MEKLKHSEFEKDYPEAMKIMQGKFRNLKGVLVEITEFNDIIKLSIGDNELYLTADQAVDLMKELRRAVVKINPKALRKKNAARA